MGLRFSDALRLSWSNITQHKKRSAIIILTISLLFGVIMGFNFIASGIEETTISASAGQTGGDVYAEAWHGGWKGYTGIGGTSIHGLEELEQISLEPVLDETDDQKVRERAAEYGGEVIGYYWWYQLDHPYHVITKSAVEKFIDPDLWENIPDGKIPTIMPEDWQAPIYSFNGETDSRFHDRVGDTLYRVGSIPSTEPGKPTFDGFNPLNIILVQLAGAPNNDFWLVDDGSGAVEEYMRSQLGAYLTEENGWYNTQPVHKIAVVEFSDPKQAVAFDSPDKEKLGVKLYTPDFRYGAQDLFGTTLMVSNSFNTQRVLLIAVEIILLIVAVIVAVMTFAHLIDQDAPTVALYRAMGASTNNIYTIYLLYLVELCLLAIAATILIALVFIGLMALTSAGALAERLQAFYHLDYLPKAVLFRPNGAFWTILGLILTIAPFSLFFTLRRFSPKHIAKKLKEN